MFIYKISQGNYDYIHEELLSHITQYTNEEFKAIVIGAINYVKKRKKDNWPYDDFDNVIQTMVDIYGFQLYDIPIQSYIYDDWNIMNIAK